MPIATEPRYDEIDGAALDGTGGRADADAAESSGSCSFPPLEHFRVQNIPPAAYYIPDFISPEEEEYLLRKIEQSPQPKWKTVGSGRRLQYWGGTMSKKGVMLPEPLPDFLTTFPNIIERIESFISIASKPSASASASVKGKERMKLDINQVLVNEYQPGQGISPHEDGPAFHPLVATVSLGSHTILDIHQYLSTTLPSPPLIASPAPADGEVDGQQGRPIAAIPLAHLLLMPRSLLILSSSLYTSHLHAITSRTKDVVYPSPRTDQETDTASTPEGREANGVTIANTDLLGDAEVVDAIRNGRWEGERGTRTSLTFRHAEKVLKGGVASIIGGALKRA
ncbi:hypothetical protein IAU59_005015 [Kwoniella sp. CBS 9459]